ncbi:DUF1697 domain-containing protein [Caldimonas sp. KR1-144]|uniref:DUF1697 domain-containing protein n=1 Tax=Caldimonas sp. KR1-144 TaxID=3400911 RepID=UPI003C03469E
MTRYVALLRGVSPMNARMPELKRCFEQAGFTDVKTLLSSGNVAFSARAAALETLERKCEAAMQAGLGRSFSTFVRTSESLQAMVAADPFGEFALPLEAKRVVSFLREPPARALALPIELDDARILKCDGREVFCAYVPGPKGPVFMQLLERTFGADITTRTFDTVRKCAVA